MSRGFSLLETLIGMAILTIVMVGTMPLVDYAMRRGTEGRRLTAAQQLAGELLEGLRNELRYDPGAATTVALTHATAWQYDVLPHAVKQASAPASPASGGVDCQLGGDGVTYHYGPYAFAREGNTFYACYALRRAAATDPRGNQRTGMPAGAADAIVRILWRDTRGWSSWAVGDLLYPGA